MDALPSKAIVVKDRSLLIILTSIALMTIRSN